ncbi:uncharacterized protein G2W53_019779 [Senna tora]|uniref:Uncharacterized protein n=1 Tax=Senna tora TaxID=362788 RepID=A0A834TU40_9FABA|nr:uncharacterized protein G2W53_019779 [Senna tora]
MAKLTNIGKKFKYRGRQIEPIQSFAKN